MPESKVNPVLDLKLKLDHEHPFLAERGITPEVAEAFGIGFADRGIMKDRIAIPIHNERGELVAYAGRYAKEDVPDGTLRYRLPKTFFKSLVLYNLHRAKEFEKRHVVIVEGFWSAVRLHRDGIPWERPVPLNKPNSCVQPVSGSPPCSLMATMPAGKRHRNYWPSCQKKSTCARSSFRTATSPTP